MKKDIFDSFSWHSSIGIDEALGDSKRFVTRLPHTAGTLRGFTASDGGKFLIHKTTKALWKVSDDKKTIEPVFATDVLTEDDVADIMED